MEQYVNHLIFLFAFLDVLFLFFFCFFHSISTILQRQMNNVNIFPFILTSEPSPFDILPFKCCFIIFLFGSAIERPHSNRKRKSHLIRFLEDHSPQKVCTKEKTKFDFDFDCDFNLIGRVSILVLLFVAIVVFGYFLYFQA